MRKGWGMRGRKDRVGWFFFKSRQILGCEGWGIGGHGLGCHTHPGANAGAVGGASMMFVIHGMGCHVDLHGSHKQNQDDT